MTQELSANQESSNQGVCSMAADFSESLFHSAFVSPVIGATQTATELFNCSMQLINNVAGSHIKPLEMIYEKPSSPTSYAGMIGAGIGRVVPFLVVAAAVRATGLAVAGQRAAGLAEEASMLPVQSFRSPVVQAFSTGAIYGGVVTPVAPGDRAGWTRLGNAVVDGATFATLTASAQAGSAGLAQSGIFRTTSPMAMMAKDVGVNMAAGIPAGLVSAEGQALFRGQQLSGDDLKQSVLGYMTVGGALGALAHGLSGDFNQLGRTADWQAAPTELSGKTAAPEAALQSTPIAASPENAPKFDAQTMRELKGKLARERRAKDDLLGLGAFWFFTGR